MFFAHKNVYYRAEPDAAIHRAVDRGLSNSILGVGSIEGQPHPETGAVLVDPNDFFIRDIASVSSFFSRYLKEGSHRFDNDNSYFGALKNFPHNTEIDVVLHFASDAPKMDIPTLADTRSFQHIYHYSLSSLPESDFRPRLADDRVGHFTTLHQDYTSVLKDDPYVRYVNRWHLELQKLIGLVLRPPGGTPEDARTLARADLQTIAAQIETRRSGRVQPRPSRRNQGAN